MRSVQRIRGDDIEQHRRQLESNPVISDISLPSSEIEYPRYNSTSNLGKFASIDNCHPWSYQPGEVDLSSYTGLTISTAAHHASVLTLSAGLGVVQGERSLSGVEYDPDRPLYDIIAGVDKESSILSSGISKSRNTAEVAFDSLIAEGTPELDRVLQSGHAWPMISDGSICPGSASASDSPAKTVHSKLSDVLTSVGFSPKRLHSSQTKLIHLAGSTPKPSRTGNRIDPLNESPAVHLHQPTSSLAASTLTKVTWGLAEDIGANAVPCKQGKSTCNKQRLISDHEVYAEQSRVELPDVTGLTSAVESPARGDQKKVQFSDTAAPSEARILATIAAVQSKLLHLESQNGISRRKLRELEMELEACKEAVKREKTKGVENEEDLVTQGPDRVGVGKKYDRTKGKDKAIESCFESSTRDRYLEVVEEKKALEALIVSLRAHLKRLTLELSSHKGFLHELKTSRNADVKRLNAKESEVETLRKEVERLAAEVEDLKKIVEEGLRERRERPVQLESKVEQTEPHDDAGEAHHKSIAEPSHQTSGRRQSPLHSPRPQDLPPEMFPSVHSPLAEHTPLSAANRGTSPFPQIRGTHLERLFFSAPEHNVQTCAACHRKKRAMHESQTPSLLPSRKDGTMKVPEVFAGVQGNADEDEGFFDGSECASECAGAHKICTTKVQKKGTSQAILSRALRELEDDFCHYKAIYIELADQYKVMDAISNIPKRNILAYHLKEVIDVLEESGNQIASLYNLVSSKDKPASCPSE